MADSNPINRRDFLRGLTASSVGLALLAEELQLPARAAVTAVTADAARQAAPTGSPVNCAVIGLGARGKEILGDLARYGAGAPVVAICDTFTAPNFLKKAQAIAPKAAFQPDYRKVLDDKTIQAVFIATPTHLHKQIALDAVAAGKHVYCEAPLANDIAEAKAIAQAALAGKTIFQPGLQQRCNLQAAHVYQFMKSEALGKMAGGRAQWHKDTSWRTAWPSAAREAELNWRLKRATSSGLLGEVGIHQLDIASWYYRHLPTAVTGYSSLIKYTDDGRDVPDTVQAVIEYPNGVRYLYDATITGSFDDTYDLFFGTDATVMLRGERAWMFKEAQSGQLGWEVFARKDVMQIGHPENGTGLAMRTGIALVADATKQLALGKDPAKAALDATQTPLYQAIGVFLGSVRAGKPVPVKEPSKDDPRPPLAPGAAEGYRATVVALKANEAALGGSRIVLDKELFTL